MSSPEESRHEAFCHSMGLSEDSPPELIRRILRYSFLHSFRYRTDAEEAEVQELRKDLEALTGWPVVERTTEEPDLSVFKNRKVEPKLPPKRLP